MEESQPRTGKRCENEYRFKKSTNLCHMREQRTPIASHNSRMYPRTGKRCKRTYRQNKTKKLCISKLFSPSPVGYESYERLGKRCKNSYRYHKPSGFCVYTKKRKRKVLNKETPLPFEIQEEILDKSVLYSPESDIGETSIEDNSVLYSPELEPKKQTDSNLWE